MERRLNELLVLFESEGLSSSNIQLNHDAPKVKMDKLWSYASMFGVDGFINEWLSRRDLMYI